MLRYLSKAGVQPTANSLLALQQKREARPLLGRDSRGNPVLKISAQVDEAWTLVNRALDAAEVDVGTRDQAKGVVYLTYTTSTPFDETEKMGFFEWLHSDRDDITLSTNALASALGVGDEASQNIRYSSRTVATVENAEEIESELSDPNNEANRKGYKIWFGGKVLYVFGSGDTGVYNTETGNYEHTGQYQLHVNRTRSGVFLSVQTRDGLEAPAIVAEEILWTVKDQLPEQI